MSFFDKAKDLADKAADAAGGHLEEVADGIE
jgi:hypothetical protein